MQQNAEVLSSTELSMYFHRRREHLRWKALHPGLIKRIIRFLKRI